MQYCNVWAHYGTVYSFILIQLVCLIAGVMDLMKYVILLFMGTYGIMHKKTSHFVVNGS